MIKGKFDFYCCSDYNQSDAGKLKRDKIEDVEEIFFLEDVKKIL